MLEKLEHNNLSFISVTNFLRKHFGPHLFATPESNTFTRFKIVVVRNLNIIDLELVRTTGIVWFRSMA